MGFVCLESLGPDAMLAAPDLIGSFPSPLSITPRPLPYGREKEPAADEQAPPMLQYLEKNREHLKTYTSTFKGVTWLEAPTPLRDLHWTLLEGPSILCVYIIYGYGSFNHVRPMVVHHVQASRPTPGRLFSCRPKVPNKLCHRFHECHSVDFDLDHLHLTFHDVQ